MAQLGLSRLVICLHADLASGAKACSLIFSLIQINDLRIVDGHHQVAAEQRDDVL
jgi:hypothetical protein